MESGHGVGAPLGPLGTCEKCGEPLSVTTNDTGAVAACEACKANA